MHMLLVYVTTFIVDSNLCVVSCKVSFIRLRLILLWGV
jgi:hypothetical protein